MIKKNEVKSIDISCKQTQASDTLTKDGERTTYTGTYKGVLTVGDKAVTAELKLKCDDKDVLEDVVPLTVGATRKMELSLTNEDLDNHKETKQT